MGRGRSRAREMLAYRSPGPRKDASIESKGDVCNSGGRGLRRSSSPLKAESNGEHVMELRRNPLTLAVLAVSLALTAACSDDTAPPTDAPPPPGSPPAEQVTPAPAPSPAQSTSPGSTTPSSSSAPSDSTGTTMPPPQEPTSPPAGTDPGNAVPDSTPSSSSMAPPLTERLALSGQALQTSAVNAAHAVGEKAGELRVAAGERMARVGQAIREGAVRADEAVQESLDKGGRPTTNERAIESAKPGTQIASGS